MFQLLLSPPPPPPASKTGLEKERLGKTAELPPFTLPPTSFFGPLQHPVNPPDSCQWPAITTKPPNIHRWGKKQPFRNLLEYVPNTKTSLATVKDFNSFTERIKGERVGCVLTWHCRKAERHSDFVRGTRLDPCIYSEAPQTSLPLKALPYWHLTFLTQGQRKWQIVSSVWTICFFFFFFFFSCFQNFHQIWRRPPSKGIQYKPSTDCKPFIQSGSELEMLKWSLPSKNLLLGF